MPAPRAAAVFEPIAPDLDLAALVESTENFEYAVRLSCDVIDDHGIEQFDKLVLLHVILGGKPLVIEGFQNRLDRWTFSTQWLRDNMGKKFEQARDLSKSEYLPLSINHYLDNMTMLTNQWTPQNYKLAKQRLYLKDIDCPELWQDKLKEQIPPSLFYLNESTGDVGNQGAVDGTSLHKGREFARAGDLMSCLPPQMRAENMMCYIGHEGTYTPAHREMCASLGHNIMVETSGSIGQDGKPTKPGSSIWFMTESKDRHLVAEYWLSTLGHDIEVETHFAQIQAWTKAPFKVYIVEQKVGDFILIPPLAPHQVWNRGTRTMKAAWNRTTVETLEMALNEALPRARMVCRDEQYKNKAIVLFTLNKYSALLKNLEYQRSVARDQETRARLTSGAKAKQLQKDFKRLFRLFRDILLSETFSLQMPEKKVEYIPFDSNITCSYCRCNIFNRFLTCKSCIVPLDDGSEDTYDVCMECYAMGRSCRCISKLSWVEQFPWKDLLSKYENWWRQLIEIENGGPSKIAMPCSLEQERLDLDKKTLAEVCQEQLRLRPFQDPKKPPESPKDSDIEENENDGTPRKKAKNKRSEKWLRENLSCHICAWRHPKWKMAICECGISFCYGSLWRGFDMMPHIIMEDKYWRCPKCRETCNCRKCKEKKHNQPYQPSGTILGHDTRKFADPRSVEALVDFSSSNSHWVKKAGDDVEPSSTRRMQMRIFEAEHAKSQGPAIDDDDDDDEAGEGEATQPCEPTADFNGNGAVPIDPLLVGGAAEVAGWNEDDSRRVARDALSAMDSLSQLERNPEEFIEQARLFNGSTEEMIIRTAVNGISYGIPIPMANTDVHAGGKKGQKGNKSGRRVHYKQKVDDEAAQFADDANRRFYQSQAQKRMAEAKKTGRLISARAAVTGDSLIVKLRLPDYRLSRFVVDDEADPVSQPAADDNAPTADVRSDLPRDVPASEREARNHQAPKKRQRGEEDDEFGSARERRKRPMTEPASGHSDENEEASNFDELEQFTATARARGGSKRRSLPGYLARRSPVRDAELPKELTTRESRRFGARTANGIPSKPLPNSTRRHGDPSASNSEESGFRPTPVRAPATRAPRKPNGAAQPDSQLSAADLNRSAKLKAIAGALSSSEEEESDLDNLIARTPPTWKKASRITAGSTPGSGKCGRGRPPKNGTPTHSSARASKLTVAPQVTPASKSRSTHPFPIASASTATPQSHRGLPPGRGALRGASRGARVKIVSERGQSRGGKVKIVSERGLKVGP